METLRAQLLRIQQQLSGLNATQRMLTAALVAIMLMTVIWWGRYAGTAEMVPVFDQPLRAEDAGKIQAALLGAQIETRIEGDRILVPSDRKFQAISILSLNDALPSSNASAAWDEMFKLMSPWDPVAKTQMIHNGTREKVLSRAISSYFPGVAKADVMISAANERRIGATIEPSASVLVTTKGRDFNTRQLVNAAAATVASAIPGMKASNVSVMIDGRRHQPSDLQSAPGGGEHDERLAALEKAETAKIAHLLPAGSLIAVRVEIDVNSSQEQRQSYDAKTTLSKERSIETETQETQQAGPVSSEPGALPNTGLAIGQATLASGNTSTVEKNRTEMEILPGVSRETINKPGGTHKVISAAVRLPRSHFVRKFRQANPTAPSKEPDDATLQPYVSAEMDDLRRSVATAANLASEDSLAISVYDDDVVPLLAATESPATGSSVGMMVGNYGKEIVLGVLAVISLFMVSTIVKKGTPAPVIAAEPEPRATPRLGADEDVAGIVGGDANATLDGMEVDESAVKAQQVVEQVATLVKEDPDAAANLVKRWLNRS